MTTQSLLSPAADMPPPAADMPPHWLWAAMCAKNGLMHCSKTSGWAASDLLDHLVGAREQHRRDSRRRAFAVFRLIIKKMSSHGTIAKRGGLAKRPRSAEGLYRFHPPGSAESRWAIHSTTAPERCRRDLGAISCNNSEVVQMISPLVSIREVCSTELHKIPHAGEYRSAELRVRVLSMAVFS
jgi:hypothetical protein